MLKFPVSHPLFIEVSVSDMETELAVFILTSAQDEESSFPLDENVALLPIPPEDYDGKESSQTHMDV